MSSNMKSIAGAVGAVVVLTMTPVGEAVAVWCSADAWQSYKNTAMRFVPFVTGLISKTGLSTEGAVINAGAAVRAEIAKATMVNKTVAEGLESYRQEQELQSEAIELQQRAQQPATTCESVATSSALNIATQNAQAAVFRSQATALSRLTSSGNTVAKLEDSHKTSNAKYCTPEEAALGVCNHGTGALAGADQDALFLFQGRDGSSSYGGSVGANGANAQADAADSYIQRLIGAAPPESLRERGAAFYQKNPQARAYAELLRRYNAMMSMGAYSLTQIKESRRPVPGLGTSTKMADAPGFAPGKRDMSMEEAVERFVATKFSPKTVTGLAVAQEPHVVLRDLAQMQSFQLWMSYQGMLQSSRTEGLMAHQLALLNEETLKPQLEAQRQAAARAK